MTLGIGGEKMSSKSSLSLVNWNEPHDIHIYYELMDDKYYIETNEGKFAIPEIVAKKFAQSIEDIEIEKSKKFHLGEKK